MTGRSWAADQRFVLVLLCTASKLHKHSSEFFGLFNKNFGVNMKRPIAQNQDFHVSVARSKSPKTSTLELPRDLSSRHLDLLSSSRSAVPKPRFANNRKKNARTLVYFFGFFVRGPSRLPDD